MLNSYKINYLKASGAVLLAVYGIILALDVSEYRFLDRVDLVAHSRPYALQLVRRAPQSWAALGQLFVPTAFTVYFFLRSELYSAAVTFFWIGQNLFNISVYIKDAQAMVLPLVSVGGGGDSIHDWNYMLSGLGLLRHDQAVGTMVYLLGCAIIISSIFCCGYLAFHDEQEAPD
jgi:hypothetical protein